MFELLGIRGTFKTVEHLYPTSPHSKSWSLIVGMCHCMRGIVCVLCWENGGHLGNKSVVVFSLVMCLLNAYTYVAVLNKVKTSPLGEQQFLPPFTVPDPTVGPTVFNLVQTSRLQAVVYVQSNSLLKFPKYRAHTYHRSPYRIPWSLPSGITLIPTLT